MKATYHPRKIKPKNTQPTNKLSYPPNRSALCTVDLIPVTCGFLEFLYLTRSHQPSIQAYLKINILKISPNFQQEIAEIRKELTSPSEIRNQYLKYEA